MSKPISNLDCERVSLVAPGEQSKAIVFSSVSNVESIVLRVDVLFPVTDCQGVKSDLSFAIDGH